MLIELMKIACTSDTTYNYNKGLTNPFKDFWDTLYHLPQNDLRYPWSADEASSSSILYVFLCARKSDSIGFQFCSFSWVPGLVGERDMASESGRERDSAAVGGGGVVDKVHVEYQRLNWLLKEAIVSG